MKTVLSLLVVLCSTASFSLGASLYYSGSNDGWWETAGNWKTDSPDGPAAASKPATGDTVYIGAGGNINVKIGSNGGSNTFYGMNINIAEGSTLTVTTNDAKCWGSTFTIGSADGLIFTNNVWGDYKNGAPAVGRQPLTFHLGLEGSVAYQANFNSSSSAHFNLNGFLDILEGGEFSIQRRDLMSFGANGDALSFNFSNFQVNFEAGEVSTLYDQSAELTATREDLGKYKLVYDADGKKLYVEYVTGSRAVPEPSVSLLGLLCVGGLLIRRRRQ